MRKSNTELLFRAYVNVLHISLEASPAPLPHPSTPKGQVVYALYAAGVIETEKLGS